MSLIHEPRGGRYRNVGKSPLPAGKCEIFGLRTMLVSDVHALRLSQNWLESSCVLFHVVRCSVASCCHYVRRCSKKMFLTSTSIPTRREIHANWKFEKFCASLFLVMLPIHEFLQDLQTCWDFCIVGSVADSVMSVRMRKSNDVQPKTSYRPKTLSTAGKRRNARGASLHDGGAAEIEHSDCTASRHRQTIHSGSGRAAECKRGRAQDGFARNLECQKSINFCTEHNNKNISKTSKDRK